MPLKIIDPDELYKNILLNGYTVYAFSKEIGVHRKTIDNLVHRKRDTASVKTAAKIAKAVDKDIKDLFEVC